MTTHLLPYTCIDGVPTLKNSEIIQVYHWTKKNKTLQQVLYNVDSTEVTENFFLRFWKREDIKMYLIFSDNKVAGFMWLDRIIDATAFIHFNSFEWTWGGRNIGIIRDAIYKIFQLNEVDVFIGQMPVTNPLAIRFSQKVGFKKSGVIPKALYVNKLNKKVDAYLSYVVKDGYCQEYLTSIEIKKCI